MENDKIAVGLIVKGHVTKRKHDENPIFKVMMKSRDKKITLNMELPDLGRQIFQAFPLGEVVEMVLKEPSQITLDTFKEESEEE